MRDLKHYSIKIEYSDDDECYVATVPELQYCSAHGATPEEALREVKIALAATLKAMKANKIPTPRTTASR